MKVATIQALPDVKVIHLDVLEDARGHFFERFNEQRFAEAGLPTRFRQDNQSRSRRGVLRGLHYQLRHPQGKLVQCIRGTIYDVAVDIRRGSPTFGRWAGVELSEERKDLLWIPPGFAHGFCALSEVAEVHYQCTELYARADDRGIRWSDPEIDISWPVRDPILSERDAQLPLLGAEGVELPEYDRESRH
jgi:dTDP-4-dehydrorhamnose 3,5-epimerase